MPHLRPECLGLLLLERNAGRQRRDVPVDVAIALPASEAEDVQALGRERLPDGFAHAMNERLKPQVLVEREIAGDLLAVRLRRDERLTAERRKLAHEHDGELVLVDDVVGPVAGDELADEAR
jgi:hypothetical protein